ncbi:MAG: phosphoenolpyruvate carboxykinase (ATP) [Chloroflexi bacterium]|nr:phosphoenolpyruvate carboxykinase (ATP) [Chloroflexota bacterium]
MNHLLNAKTPAQSVAMLLKSDYGLENHGFINLGRVYWNLPPAVLYEESLFRGEGWMVDAGPLLVHTGKHTARSASDKFIVREPESEAHVWWGSYNRPFAPEKFEDVYNRLLAYFQGRDVFVQDVYAGADPNYRLRVRIITETAWHSLFARNMFIPPTSREEYQRFIPEFTLIAAPGFKAFPPMDATRSETFILIHFGQHLGLIGNTAYAGEIKKTIFTVLNYLLPLQGVLPMHCSANVAPDDPNDVAIFFGLSGTGKTTLSADPSRRLIGDDEHGWSEAGVFNFENGCYAKVIRLSPTAEPQIYAATRRFGTILENVVFDPLTRRVDLDSDEITENTRASYPLEFIENALLEKRAGQPRNIVFLTCDASGVMPPIARLTPEQAIYQFISGYTSKIAGTEVGLGREPEITFSACFGAPFMVHHPYTYAELLRQKIERYNVRCWLVNTGWIGGPYGIGKRISIHYTRAMLAAALKGDLEHVPYRADPVFGFQVPLQCPGIPDEVLDPSSSWSNKDEYWKKYRQLAMRFIENFRKFADACPPEVLAAGPKV